MSYVPTPSGLQRSGYVSDITAPAAGVVLTTWSVGVLHAYDSTLKLPLTHYWLTDVTLAPQAIALLQQHGFDGFTFTPYSSTAAWTTVNPSEPIEPGHIDAASLLASTPALPPGPAHATTTARDPPAFGFMSPPAMQRQHSTVTPGTTNRQPLFPPQAAPPPAAPPAAADATAHAPPPAAPAAAHIPAASTPAAASSDPAAILLQMQLDSQRLIAQMHESNLRMERYMATIQANASATKELTAPIQKFPIWDGDDRTKNDFLEQLLTYKQDPFYSGADWTKTIDGYQAKSTFLRSQLLQFLPAKTKKIFEKRPEFEKDGFAMWARLMQELSPSDDEMKLLSVVEFGNLSQGPSESLEDYMARCRDLLSRLKGVKVDEMLPFWALCQLNLDLFPGLSDRIANADPALLSADLDQIETMLKHKQRLQVAMGITQQAIPSARPAAHQKQPAAPSPAPTPPAASSTYPFPAQKWRTITRVAKATPDFCPGCGEISNRHKSGCPPWACNGWVIKQDPAAAAKIWEPYKKRNEEKANAQRGGRANRTSEEQKEDPQSTGHKLTGLCIQGDPTTTSFSCTDRE